MTTLKLVKSLVGEELVKYLQDVFDSLFAMFSTEEGIATPHSGLVFEVLVTAFLLFVFLFLFLFLFLFVFVFFNSLNVLHVR